MRSPGRWGKSTVPEVRPRPGFASHVARIAPVAAVDALEALVGLGVADDRLGLRVPLEAAPELQREHPQQAHRGRAVPGLDVADRALAAGDALEEVRPELADVL